MIDIPDSDLVHIILIKSLETIKKSLESHKH